MKRALVLSLICVLGLAFTGFAASLTGSWDTDIVFTVAPALTVSSLTSILHVDYAIDDWTFGFNAFIGNPVADFELFDLNFDVAGSLGAFSLYSFLDFDPTIQTPAFTSWENVVRVSIAGVDLYAAFALQDLDLDGVIGSGWAVGGYASAGLVEIWAEADFNISSGLYYIDYYGYWGAIVDWATWYSCVSDAWYSGFWTVTDETCVAGFTNFDIKVKAPFTCLDFIIWANFDCTNGFDYVKFMLNDIDIGGGWFQLDDLDITFTGDTKTVSADLTLTLGSAVCVTPYFDLNQVGLNVIDGITLRALLLSYTYNGVTIKAGELFTSSIYPGNGYYSGFTKSGSLSYYGACAVPYADEFIGLWFDGDSCCGGLTSASVVLFFDGIVSGGTSTSTGIFDFVLLVADVEVGIGSGFSIRGGLELADTGLDNLSVGFSFSF